jgi:RNA polymerase sigma factor (sigma-70 family)
MPPEHATRVFEAHRPRLLRLAYRMLGSVAEAEDIVQDAWLRWHRVEPDTVREPSAFLSRIVTRLCLDAMKSARVRRETYVGTWLPEPMVEPEAEDARLDDLTLHLMLAMERLSPLERATFLLHDVFGVPLQEVASTLNRDAGAIRQLAVRARKHVRDARPRFPLDRAEGDRIAQAFFIAYSSGDIGMLRSMLAQTVVLTSDGGGKVYAAINPIVGQERVLRLFRGLDRKLTNQRAVFIRSAWIDGLPGYISRERDRLMQTTALDIRDGRISGIFVTRNPDKLSHVTRALMAGAGEASLH